MTYGIIDMNNYEEIMNSLVKFRDHCKEQRSCDYCEFQEWCDTNIINVEDEPMHWVFDDEEIICDG